MESNKTTCQKCRDCCKFYDDGAYFAPLFTKKEVEEIEKIIGKTDYFKKFKKSRNVFQIKLVKSKKQHEINVCPLLDEENHLCKVYDLRPFDCRIWPFIFMKDKKGKVVLAYINVDGCPISNDMTESEFESYKGKVYEWLEENKILELIKYHKELVWDYEPDTVIVKEVA